MDLFNLARFVLNRRRSPQNGLTQIVLSHSHFNVRMTWRPVVPTPLSDPSELKRTPDFKARAHSNPDAIVPIQLPDPSDLKRIPDFKDTTHLQREQDLNSIVWHPSDDSIMNADPLKPGRNCPNPQARKARCQ